MLQGFFGSKQGLPKLDGDSRRRLLGQPPVQVLAAPGVAARQDLLKGLRHLMALRLWGAAAFVGPQAFDQGCNSCMEKI